MTLTKTIQHDRYTIMALVICLIIPASIFGCHLSKTQKKDLISTAAITAEAAATGTPIPWTDIGIALSTIFGSGVFIDNRRKDILIKRLKKDDANKNAILNTIAGLNRDNLTRAPPINPN